MGTTRETYSTTAGAASGHQGPQPESGQRRRERSLWRSRWAAIGAAVAVAFGGGTLHFASASDHAPSSIVSVTPVRVLDTRDPTDLGLAGPFVSAVGQELQVTGMIPTIESEQTVVPVGATGVFLNVTVVLPTADGFVSVRPAGVAGPPSTSSLNFEAGDITPNAVFVALPVGGPTAGKIELTYDAFGALGPTTDLLADIVGYTVTAPALLPDEIDAYTKAEADGRFVQTTDEIDAYTKAEADGRFVQTTDEIGVNGYQRIEDAGVFDTNRVKSVVATCPEGTVVTGGGGSTFPSLADPNRDFAPLQIRFNKASGQRSWVVQAVSMDPTYAFAWRATAQAICVKVADD